MKKLIQKKPVRLFTFGCSFTDYKWATWANILAYEFDCEFYNFGKSGAGNSYIVNQLTQANNYYGFNKDDLIIISWTNISREDRWSNLKGWVTPGNIYSQHDYDKNFINNWANEIHFALRDFANIDLAKNYLENLTNYHFISMCDITKHINQWENKPKNVSNEIKDLIDLYQDSLDSILPSFYEVLWDGNIDNKWRRDWRDIHKNFSDGHPTIQEHYQYLIQVFDYEFSKKTKQAVKSLHNDWVEYIREGYRDTKVSCGLHDMPAVWTDKMYDNYKLKKSEAVPYTLYH